MSTPSEKIRIPRPSRRRLRAFAFDPILSTKIDTRAINEVTISLPWDDGLQPGPVDDYIEVVDYDPASQAFYAPVNLADPHLLAQDGLAPSEGNPQFHQQMVYAVARTTIDHFERALGRRALWSPHYYRVKGRLKDECVERLRIYPHALREANAYYNPEKKALLFGYFPASTAAPGENLPGGTVFTCLSHDIVAHETTHALLDGLHRRFIEPTNADVWALHEAFADIVALFQHFTYPDVLRHQIARTRGELDRQNLLGALAYQFGQAIGHYGALRSGLGSYDESGAWVPEKPDPNKLLTTTEPHARGAILVAAVFEAFLTIYKWRIADLLRIATGGTGVLPAGELHPDLVDRLASEAAKTAGHLLHMCIRALDYCPPVDVDFGDYLRALITADADLVTDDRHNYRLAVIEAFRRRGIYPRDVRNLSEESLVWQPPSDEEQQAYRTVFGEPARFRQLVPDWGLNTSRAAIYDHAEASQKLLHDWFTAPEAAGALALVHFVLGKDAPPTIYRKLEVHSVRPARRVSPDGGITTDLVIEMTQRRRGYLDPEVQTAADAGAFKKLPEPDFVFRGGCTLLADLDTGRVRYCIYKRIGSSNRLKKMQRYLAGDDRSSAQATYLGDPARQYFRRLTAPYTDSGPPPVEPFALLHRFLEEQEEG